MNQLPMYQDSPRSDLSVAEDQALWLINLPSSPQFAQMSKPVLLLGCGGHARSVIDLVESSSDWCVYGLVGRKDEVGMSVLGYPVLGCDEDLDTLRNLCSNALLAIGQIGISPLRSYLGTKLLSLGYDLPVVISPSAYVSRHSSIDIGTTVGHGAVKMLAPRSVKTVSLTASLL